MVTKNSVLLFLYKILRENKIYHRTIPIHLQYNTKKRSSKTLVRKQNQYKEDKDTDSKLQSSRAQNRYRQVMRSYTYAQRDSNKKK